MIARKLQDTVEGNPLREERACEICNMAPAIEDVDYCYGCARDCLGSEWQGGFCEVCRGPRPQGWAVISLDGRFYCARCATKAGIRFCRDCGCTDWAPCDGGCSWATESEEADQICSECDDPETSPPTISRARRTPGSFDGF